jgi:hypothetical protein
MEGENGDGQDIADGCGNNVQITGSLTDLETTAIS